MTLVGIGHVAQVGKSTSAEGLKHDLQFREVSFADPLKVMAMKADPMILSNSTMNVAIGAGHLAKLVQSMGWDKAKVTFPEIRAFLQRLGTAVRDVMGEDTWLKLALDNVYDDERVVVADVRYRNEFDAVRQRGGFLIKVTRPGHVAYGHVSETELLSVKDDEWDAVIENTGTVIELQQKVVEAVRQHMRHREE